MNTTNKYLVNFDAIGRPFITDTYNNQTYHIGQEATTLYLLKNDLQYNLHIKAFYINDNINSPVNTEHKNKLYNNITVLLAKHNGEPIGYAQINHLIPTKQPNTDLPKYSPNYRYLLTQ